MDTMSDALQEFLDTVLENAPTAAAVGGAAASTALVMNPSLPMTMASGVPPGNHHTGRNCFNLFQISFSAYTAETDPGMSGVSKDQKFKNTHCQN